MTLRLSLDNGPIADWRRHGAAAAVARLRGVDLHEAATQIFPGQPTIALKAASSPASTGGWGQQLSQTETLTREFLDALRGRSAAAQLLGNSLKVDLSGARVINMPRAATDWPAPAWIAEGGPIPVQQGSLTFEALGPMRKLMAIAVLTMELAELSGAAAETIIGDLMLDAAGRALDVALFSTTAADGTTRPAGLLNGVTPITAAGASGSLQDRAVADIAAMTAAIAAGGAGGSILLFAAPAQAMVLSAVTNLTVTAAPNLAAGTVIAVDPNAIAWAGDLPPKIETSENALLHMEDSAPLAIGTAGTPNTVAASVRSIYQTGSHALRMRLPVTWVKRSAASVQMVTGANW